MPILATTAVIVLGLIWSAGARGVGAAIVITAGLGDGPGSVVEQAHQAGGTYGLRLLGPNCLGLFVPSARLNGGFAVHQPKIGDLRAHFTVGRITLCPKPAAAPRKPMT